jgi:hypothetical protein|uniref:Uncharacterized protein n=1 Tax=viral metagenome TaxID=1070528 RepID=A0A6C0H153_9ZZZZ
MDNIFTKLDFDNPILISTISLILTLLYQYIETIYDDKKIVSIRLSLVVSLLVFLIVYYITNKHAKMNITTQEIFTDMGIF